MDDDYTKADFLADTAVRYWDGAYAEELMAIHFGWSVA
jgi:hypothetical protein